MVEAAHVPSRGPDAGHNHDEVDSTVASHDVAEHVDSSPNEMAPAVTDEDALYTALGLTMLRPQETREEEDHEEDVVEEEYDVVHNPEADDIDLSVLRGTRAPKPNDADGGEPEEELTALAELVPALQSTMQMTPEELQPEPMPANDNGHDDDDDDEDDIYNRPGNRWSTVVQGANNGMNPGEIENLDSMKVQESKDEGDVPEVKEPNVSESSVENRDANNQNFDAEEQNLLGFDNTSDHAPQSNYSFEDHHHRGSSARRNDTNAGEFRQAPSTSNASLSTATQTHEVRMPMYLPTFKPATGCTNASDFIVRCFVARLRSGITVVKHGRSRWCKSRLRILHVHSDGRSLSWKPALGEPSSSKRPPKLDLSTCTEVRHAWSPDPLNPMFTGTPVLRQKCEAANAHKSFALIFPRRTVDITAVTADQCKVLMEGFSALCFRLQVANLAAQSASGKKDEETDNREAAEDGTTASVTMTDHSTPNGPRKSESNAKRSNYW